MHRLHMLDVMNYVLEQSEELRSFEDLAALVNNSYCPRSAAVHRRVTLMKPPGMPESARNTYQLFRDHLKSQLAPNEQPPSEEAIRELWAEYKEQHSGAGEFIEAAVASSLRVATELEVWLKPYHEEVNTPPWEMVAAEPAQVPLVPTPQASTTTRVTSTQQNTTTAVVAASASSGPKRAAALERIHNFTRELPSNNIYPKVWKPDGKGNMTRSVPKWPDGWCEGTGIKWDEEGNRIWPEGQDPVYCYCMEPYDSDKGMVECSGEKCEWGWFHWRECLGIKRKPAENADWYCPSCELAKFPK